jgi:hypothetical protein
MSDHHFTRPIHRKMGHRSHDITYECDACGMRSDWEGAKDPCPSSLRAIVDGTKREGKLLVHRKSGFATACGRMIDGLLKTSTLPDRVTCRWCITRARRAEAAE